MSQTYKQPVLHALDQLDSLRRELEKGRDGGVIAQRYVEEKLDLLRQDFGLIFNEGPVVTVRND